MNEKIKTALKFGELGGIKISDEWSLTIDTFFKFRYSQYDQFFSVSLITDLTEEIQDDEFIVIDSKEEFLKKCFDYTMKFIEFGADPKTFVNDLSRETALKRMSDIVEPEDLKDIPKAAVDENWEFTVDDVIVFHYQTKPYMNFFITINTDEEEIIFEEKFDFKSKDEFKEVCKSYIESAFFIHREEK